MSKTFPTPYPELNSVLQDLVDSVQAILGIMFVGAYLQGSFAVGDFDLHSDVDFIMVTEEELSDEEVHGLQAIHERIYCLDSPWAQHLEGSYFPREVLRYSAHSGEQLWYLDHGSRSLIQSDHCNTVLVRWVVRENGVTLAGPSPAMLVDPITVEMLREQIMATIHDWGQEILSNPDHFNNRFYQGFIVLNYCRMLHDLHRDSLAPSWRGLSGQRRTSTLPGRGLLIERGTDALIRRSQVASLLIQKISKLLWNSSTIVETKRILEKRNS